jgi:DNA-binding transcriptional regulator YiaG
MKGREIRAIRKRLGLSQSKLADVVGVQRNTVARWERDELQIGEPAARLIRIIGGGPVPFEPRRKTRSK